MDYRKESLKLHGQWKGKIEVNARAKVNDKDPLALDVDLFNGLLVVIHGGPPIINALYQTTVISSSFRSPSDGENQAAAAPQRRPRRRNC